MVRINTAYGPCRVRKAAFYFFESSAGAGSGLLDFVLAARPLAFAADDEDFGRSLAVCPTPPQNRQVVGKTTSSFRDREFAVFSELVAQVRCFLARVVSGQAGVVLSRRFLMVFVLAALIRGRGRGLILWFFSPLL